MKEEVRRKITEIIGEMHCPKDFECAESGFEELCRVRNIGLESYLECLEPDAKYCMFNLPFGKRYYCRCPLRVYLAQTLKM